MLAEKNCWMTFWSSLILYWLVTMRREMTKNIRLSLLSFKELQSVRHDADLHPDLVLEAVMSKLEKHELSRGKPSFFSAPHLRPRECSISLEYSSSLQRKGVLYWLATACGAKEYENPHVSGLIEVTCSSLEKGSVHDLVSYLPVELWTKSVPSSWFCVDLGKTRRLALTHYTLRHGGNYKGDMLRNWDLQGSNDKQGWVTLSRHTADHSLNDVYAVCSWPVPNRFDTDKNPPKYRFFRIIQTGHNSSHHNFLSLSGIEFYGELFTSNLEC